MSYDNTRAAFKLKQAIARTSSADIVLASRWMMQMAQSSPMGRNARFHHIPFGVDLSRFSPKDPSAARAALGVRPGHVVVASRGYGSPFKGVRELAKALEQITTPLCLVSIHDEGHFDELIGQHQVIALDWSDDEDRLIEAYTAADFFVMPSTAEAFGMMAVEAMACGKPVIVFEGTSLPEVTFAPDCGIAVPMRDVAALTQAVAHLAGDEADRSKRGQDARLIAEKHYPAELYADRLAELYYKVAKRRPVVGQVD